MPFESQFVDLLNWEQLTEEYKALNPNSVVPTIVHDGKAIIESSIINEYIDEDWIPFLQTPPFPEYTSGHSVISRSAAVILTNILGKNFKFLDTSEIEYGLPSREFNSFLEASDEAAISRIYGGIHYMPAIYNGVRQGEMVGNYILSNIDLIDPYVVKK